MKDSSPWSGYPMKKVIRVICSSVKQKEKSIKIADQMALVESFYEILDELC